MIPPSLLVPALREPKHRLRNLTRSDIAKLGASTSALRNIARGLGSELRSPKGRRLGDKPFAHPHYWAAFVLTGDPR